ncbi:MULTISPECIES: WhiB family transcriptional regulator [Streptomyces]|uniref:WhiB family transcriptional regulator n=1 Tax=Streptomyces TaxID=1883 RepID=UPI0034604A03
MERLISPVPLPLARPAAVWDRFWRQRGACALGDRDRVFARNRSADQDAALRLCRFCAVQTEYLAHALDERILEGVYGGTTSLWRQQLLARRPGVTPWHRLLARAHAEHHRCLPAPPPHHRRPSHSPQSHSCRPTLREAPQP